MLTAQASLEASRATVSAIDLSDYAPMLICSPGSRPKRRHYLDSRRAELKRLLNDKWEYTLRHSPELATHVGDNRYNDRLSDFSDKAIAENLAHQRPALKQFEALDVTGVPEEEKLNQAALSGKRLYR